jgi:hypothetical protein
LQPVGWFGRDNADVDGDVAELCDGAVEQPEPALDEVVNRLQWRCGGRCRDPTGRRSGAVQEHAGGVADQPVGEKCVELVVIADTTHGEVVSLTGEPVDDDYRLVVLPVAPSR